MKRSAYRRFMDGLRSALMYIAIAIVCALLVGVIGYIFVRGIPHISWEFLSTKPSPRSGTIGILPDLLNTLYIILMTIVIVLPLGVGAAIYLTEYAKNKKLVRVIEFATETLSGIPSIVYGLFGMLFFVTYLHWGYSLLAGAIGIVLVCLFMLIVYRIPGLVACLALGFYIVIEAVVFGLIRVNLSLPGIAGIILSIGMAVDANVIIFERIKEELRAGKTVKSAIDSGFKRAFTAILDSNITTLIAAAVLFWMGTGTIVGFATTLGLGVIISMFTALTVTHFLLNRMVDFHVRSPKAYGV